MMNKRNIKNCRNTILRRIVFSEKLKCEFINAYASLWPLLPHMNTTKNHSRNFFSLSFTPTPSLRFLKVYYFTKLKYVHEIQFTLILLWWDIFWELKPKNFFYVERSTKKFQMVLSLFLVIALYCQASSSQFFSITQPLTSFSVLAGWEGSLGACSRQSYIYQVL